MKIVLVAAAALAAMASCALAAGGATAGSGTPWTGFYFGANTSWNWLSTDASSATQSYGSLSGNGIGGGIQLGFDYQLEDMVLGIQAITSVTAVDAGTRAGDSRLGTNLSSYGSLNARLGYLLQPELLAYAKTGLAFTSFSYTDKNGTEGYSGSQNDERHQGWMVGGGLEYMIAPHWSAFAEYDYTAIPEATVALSYRNAPWGDSFKYRYDQNVGSAVIGVNYRF